MKKILLLSALLLGMGIANVTIAQQKAPLPKKGSDQVVPDYKKPKTVVAPKSDKPISAPKTGEVKSAQGGAAAPSTVKPGKGSVQMVPDYKKPKTVGIPKSGKPISAPKTGEVKGGTKPTGGIKPAPSTGKPTGGIKPAPSAGKPVNLTPKDDKVTKATVEVKGKGKGSVPMVPDYKQSAKKPK